MSVIVDSVVGSIVERNAVLYGDKPAIIFEDRVFTHREFRDRAYRLANALIGRGIRRQQRIGVLAKNCNAYLEIFAAAELTGFVVVNLNHRLVEAELAPICNDAEPAVLFYSEEFADKAAALQAACGSIGMAFSLEESYEAMLDAASPERPALRALPTDTVYLIYTSGSTGRPKGVMCGQRQITIAARCHSHEAGVATDDVSLIVMPLFHIGAKIEQLTFMFLGGTIVLHATFDPEEALKSIERHRVTIAHLAPIMIQRVLDLPGIDAYDLSSLRSVHYASAPMAVSLLRRAIARFGPIFMQIYGMTEMTGGTVLKAHFHRPDGDEDDLRRLGSAGQPFYETSLRLLDESGNEVAEGEIGEVVLKGRYVMQGYWNNSTGTAEVLRDGWLHTGDMGYLDRHGFLYIADRKKDMIISGGENIYSWEVEEALRSHDAVAEVAVIAVPDPEWGESVRACVVLKAGTGATEAELIDHCRQRLASYKKPRAVDFIDALPRLFNGKIDKKALRAGYWGDRLRQVS